MPTLQRKLFLLLLAFVLLGSFQTSSPLHAELKPSEEMESQTEWVVDTIKNRHYLHESIAELDGREMVEAYTESFDRNKMYFTQKDVDEFAFRFADSMEQFLEKGNLYAAFAIYKNFRETVQSRNKWIRKRLEESFDFSEEATFQANRRELDWPEDQESADDLWERRLKYDLLNEMLSYASEDGEDEDGEDEESMTIDPSTPGSNNPDALSPQGEEDFDPDKLRRLLEDEAFFKTALETARESVRERYDRLAERASKREPYEIQESFINAMTHLFDPHSSFLSADTLKSFQSSVQNSFVGIGAMLEDKEGICTIKKILPGGPAEESGLLHEGDEIRAVAQGEEGEFENIVNEKLRSIVRKIKGEEDTIVRLRIHPAEAADPSVRKDISIVRGEVKLTANLASARVIEVPAGNTTVSIGAIELPSFYGNIGTGDTPSTTSEDVSELLEKLKEVGVEGIVLDLRMNGGGLLNEAIRVAGLFIPDGPIVQVRGADGNVDILSDKNPEIEWEGPLAVLTSRFSASASEIVAGALRDHNRALIIGNSSTHGKGTVQEVFNMPTRSTFSFFGRNKSKDPVASKITIKQFFLPDGHSTQVKGVPSDVVLPSANEFLPIGESDLDHALPWDSIKPVKWDKEWSDDEITGLADASLKKTLMKASANRMESLPEFSLLNKQVELRKERYEEDEISLRLEDRIRKRINEWTRIDALDQTYEELSEQNEYPSESFKVEAAREQDALSERNRNKNTKKAEDDESMEEDASAGEEEPEFDIYLRESARILADWIRLKSGVPREEIVKSEEGRDSKG